MAVADAQFTLPRGRTSTYTVPVEWTGEFEWLGASGHAAQVLDIPLDFVTILAGEDGKAEEVKVPILGDFWLKLQEEAGTPVAPDDVDIQIQPLMRNSAGVLAVTQQAAVDIANAADFSAGTGNRLHGYSLNSFFALNGNESLYLGMDGFRITLDPAANATLTIPATVIGR